MGPWSKAVRQAEAQEWEKAEEVAVKDAQRLAHGGDLNLNCLYRGKEVYVEVRDGKVINITYV